jgi:FtsH-binding integral membrane protein
MKKTMPSYFLTVVGVVLLIVSLYFIKTIEDPQGMLRALLFICFGLGCAIFGHGLSELIGRLLLKNHPAAAKQLEIEKKDERNLAIANGAKAKAYDMMIFVFGALILAVSLMGIDLIVVLLLVFTYLFILGYCTYYRLKYYKEM